MTRSGKPFDESLFVASGGPELIAALQAEVTEFRVHYARMLDVVAEVEQCGIAQVAGYSSTRALLVDAVRVAPAQATKMVVQAAQVTETRTPTGHLSPAPLPTARAALHEGLLDGEHVSAIAETLKQLPDTASVADRETLEATLAETARTAHPGVVRQHGEALLAFLDQDGRDPGVEDKLAEPKNVLSYRRNRDGRMKFAGEIEPEAAEVFEQLLDTFGKPHPLPNGTPDPRTPRERHGDALSEIIHRAANPEGTAKAHLTVFLDLNVLTDAVGTATLESGCHLSPSSVRRLACDAKVIPMVLNGDSVPLDVGHRFRLVTPGQRAALIARDRGCAYPGCCNPARWADAHHIIHWQDGGPTNLDNLVLLCRRHHRVLHHSAWKIRVTNGLPEFIPPKWIDPDQQPMRNTLHLRP